MAYPFAAMPTLSAVLLRLQQEFGCIVTENETMITILRQTKAGAKRVILAAHIPEDGPLTPHALTLLCHRLAIPSEAFLPPLHADDDV